METWATVIGLIGGALGISGAVVAVVARLAEARVKTYAAQRDFEHLKRTYEQLNANITFNTKEQERHFEDVKNLLRDLKMILNKRFTT